MTEDDEPADAPDDEDETEASFADRLAAAEEAVEAAGDGGGEEFEAAFDAIDAATGAAETEVDLDSVEALIEDAAGALEAADLPEPEDEDEDDPREALESRLDETRAGVEEARGPYAEDVVETVGDAGTTVADTRWTEAGEAEVVAAVAAFADAVNGALGADIGAADDLDGAPETLDAAGDAIREAGLDPDDDADTITALVEAGDALTAGLDEAEEWSDLSTREQLEAQGFYDVLGHHKDYPPEWSALKEHEKRGNVDMILLALEKLGMDFMEEHCLDALKRMGDEAAVEPMLERAGRRDKPGIEILGKIGAEEAVETIVEYLDTDSDPQLQKVTLKALGEIGAEEATGPVANKLVSENETIRSHAARALGMIGDTRAVEPLTDVLANDESGTVRTSAAWALNQIGTRRALEAAAEYADDRAYLVQSEAEKAAKAL